MTLHEMNTADRDTVRDRLMRCCGSEGWASAMLMRRPFANADSLYNTADELWWGLPQTAWLEAFSRHPRIGEKKQMSEWSAAEQRGMSTANGRTARALHDLNRRYESKFGWIFIACATGKSADEMKAALEQRLENSATEEIRIAASEQAKITRLRLEKLLAE